MIPLDSLAVIPGFSAYRARGDGAILSCLTPRGTGHGGARSHRDTGTPRRLLAADVREYDGRKRYTLRRDDGRYVRRYGSYFVLLAFVGPQPAGLEACHNNGDCTDDAADNLRWGTPTANKADMLTHGTRLQGEHGTAAKLTDVQADEIISRRRSGERGVDLATEFGVSAAAISFIYTGKRKRCLRRRTALYRPAQSSR
jgi:hypothetical protein